MPAVGLGEGVGDGVGVGVGLGNGDGPTCACADGITHQITSASPRQARKPLARPQPVPASFAREERKEQRMNPISKEQRQPKDA